MRAAAFLAATLGVTSIADADFTYVTNFTSFQSLVPSYTTVDLVDLTAGDWLSDQYTGLGVLFDGGLIQETATGYLQDGHGVYGGCFITMSLDVPAYAVGSHHPGSMGFDLYAGDTLLYESLATGTGLNNFRGVVSSVPFDKVVLRGITLGPPSCDAIFVDNFYFASVPSPGAAAVFLLGPAANARRRRGRVDAVVTRAARSGGGVP